MRFIKNLSIRKGSWPLSVLKLNRSYKSSLLSDISGLSCFSSSCIISKGNGWVFVGKFDDVSAVNSREGSRAVRFDLQLFFLIVFPDSCAFAKLRRSKAGKLICYVNLLFQ